MVKSHRVLNFIFIGLILVLSAIGIWKYNGAHKQTAANNAESSAQEDKNQEPQVPSFNRAQYSISDPSSIWIVVNKQRPLNPLAYAPVDLISIGNGQSMRKEAAAALQNMYSGARAAGYNLVSESGYRSYATQTSVYNNEVKQYGQTTADQQSARPGHSEHQTGWAVDIGTAGCYEDCFGKTAAAVWVKENAYKYGFIQRYPESKSDITGYRHEPWHFRYVGIDLAAELQKTGQTLEEFFGLPAAPNY